MRTAHADPVRAARQWAALYRRLGYQPLPSDPAGKKPLCRYAEWWESAAPDDLFDRFRTTNLQVMAGRFWGLAVLDLDGAGAVAEAAKWNLPRTWTVWHSRGGKESRHLWFRVRRDLPERRKRVIWAEWDDAANGWAKHRAVELLCDRSLVMAPPSVHPRTGRVYGWEVGPMHMTRPAWMPRHVWEMPPVEPPAHARPAPPPAEPRRQLAARPTARGRSLRHVLDAITDKAAVARDLWGVRFARVASESSGWVSCHDPTREDNHPSARFHVETGALWTPHRGIVPFCKIPVELGLFADWREVVDDLADRFHVL